MCVFWDVTNDRSIANAMHYNLSYMFPLLYLCLYLFEDVLWHAEPSHQDREEKNRMYGYYAFHINCRNQSPSRGAGIKNVTTPQILTVISM